MYVMQAGDLSQWEVARLVALSAKTDLRPGPGGSRITPVGLDDVRSVAPVLCDGAYGVGFVALYPSSQLVAHRDPPIRGKRYHVPIQVNEGCWVFHGWTWQQLQIGRVYEMDPTVQHGAVNWGDTVRIHLMVDVE